MRSSKSNVMHRVVFILAMLSLMGSLVLPGYSSGRFSRPAVSTKASHLHSQLRPGGAPSLNSSRAPAPPSRQEQAKPESRIPEPLGKIAFSSDRDGNFEIYVMNPDGGGQTRLTQTSTDNLRPTWSPDGTKIAFETNRDGNSEIYVMNADGTGQTNLTNNPGDDLEPAWSPDGTKIAFVSNRNGNDEIFVMNADGSNPTNLTNNPADDFNPAWSPSGSKLAFASNRDNHFDIYTMDSNGGNVARLTADADVTNPDEDLHPSWSPAKITFQSNRDGTDQIYVMNPDGSNQMRLTNNAALDIQPSRSSDGAKIAFASTRDDNLEIYVMNADGSNQMRLTNHPASDIQPAIQPLPSASNLGTIQFSQGNYTVDHSASSVTITVTRAGNTSGAAAVDFAAFGGTASDRSDFNPAFGTLNFAAGETSQTFTISIINNGFLEEDRTINLTLSNPTGAILGTPNAATVTIVNNNQAPSATNPIDDQQTFVRQQYLDFLAREPDATGLAFWTGQITGCGSDTACTNRRRVEVSAAFFLSKEFQDSGFFLIRLYKAAFNRFPTYLEFIRDRGQLIGGPNLEGNKTAFTGDFVNNRADFKSLYDGKTNDQYVDALNANTGGALTQADRDALVSGLNNGTETRVTVLRKVVDNASFIQRQLNRAFVLIEYFGYLRRDSDPSGFAFWLNVLETSGDFRGMVCAFITSTEYQQRFSTVVTRSNATCGGGK